MKRMHLQRDIRVASPSPPKARGNALETFETARSTDLQGNVVQYHIITSVASADLVSTIRDALTRARFLRNLILKIRIDRSPMKCSM